jgi:hypothetical protein
MNPFGDDAAGTVAAAAFKNAKPDAAEEKEDETQRSRLIEIALSSGISFWHDADGNAFASVPTGGHFERYRVRTGRFKLHLRRIYGDAYPNLKTSKKLGYTVPSGVSDTAMNEALPTLEAIAQKGAMREPRVRILRDDTDGTVWIDFGDETWRSIAVTASGWRVVSKADVPLIRSKGVRALPTPRQDPDALANLRALLNLSPEQKASKAAVKLADDCFKVVVAFMLSVLWPRGPYCVLIVNGEQGSAKSTLCRIIRAITDPNKVPLRKVPRDPDDLLVTAQHSRLLALDNISHLSVDLADVICGIATGTGGGKRELYSNAEEAIIAALNPVLINGIEGLLTRGDLADRSLMVMLSEIRDDKRRDEAEIEEEIARVAPGVLALLLDGLVEAMRTLTALKLSRMPRMADFARLACAAAPAFGWAAEDMLTVLEDNRRLTVEAVIAADVVATTVLDFLDQRLPGPDGWAWVGSATDLLAALKPFVPEDTVRSKSWPKTSHHLSARLKRAIPALRRAGYAISTWREEKKGHRKIGIKADARGESKQGSASAASAATGAANFNDLASRAASAAASAERQPSADEDDDIEWEVETDAQRQSASAAVSAKSADQASDKAEEYHYDDATDAADAELHPPLPLEEENDDEERL